MEQIKDDCQAFLRESECDAIAVAVVNFVKNSFETVQYSKLLGTIDQDTRKIYYDLASLSKPLTLSLGYFANPSIVTNDMMLLLNHRGGLPAWGLLPKHGWQEIIQSYSIKESDTLYSDYSALRLMLEYNAKSEENIHKVCRKILDSEVIFWKDLPEAALCIQCGYRDGKPNMGVVHDPNAYVINDYVGHAGMFGTIEGAAKSLLNFNKSLNLISVVTDDIKKVPEQRFHLGWDTVSKDGTSTAGVGCSENTFGHLGFTGTSIWIDPVRMAGLVVLTNAVKHYWYDKDVLNKYRKKMGTWVWQKFS